VVASRRQGLERYDPGALVVGDRLRRPRQAA